MSENCKIPSIYQNRHKFPHNDCFFFSGGELQLFPFCGINLDVELLQTKLLPFFNGFLLIWNSNEISLDGEFLIYEKKKKRFGGFFNSNYIYASIPSTAWDICSLSLFLKYTSFTTLQKLIHNILSQSFSVRRTWRMNKTKISLHSENEISYLLCPLNVFRIYTET